VQPLCRVTPRYVYLSITGIGTPPQFQAGISAVAGLGDGVGFRPGSRVIELVWVEWEAGVESLAGVVCEVGLRRGSRVACVRVELGTGVNSVQGMDSFCARAGSAEATWVVE